MPAKPIVKAAPLSRTYTLQPFEVPPRHLRHEPIKMAPLQVTARSGDEARRLFKAELRATGRVVRNLSSSQTHVDFVAYVDPPPTAPSALRSPPRR